MSDRTVVVMIRSSGRSAQTDDTLAASPLPAPNEDGNSLRVLSALMNAVTSLALGSCCSCRPIASFHRPIGRCFCDANHLPRSCRGALTTTPDHCCPSCVCLQGERLSIQFDLHHDLPINSTLVCTGLCFRWASCRQNAKNEIIKISLWCRRPTCSCLSSAAGSGWPAAIDNPPIPALRWITTIPSLH